MSTSELVLQVKEAADRAAVHAEDYSGLIGAFKEYIVETFGPNGWLAICIFAGIISVLLLIKLAKLALSTLKYVVVPAVTLAVLAMFVLNMSFIVALPVTTVACSLILLFKA